MRRKYLKKLKYAMAGILALRKVLRTGTAKGGTGIINVSIQLTRTAIVPYLTDY